jgi:hypothetical protein
VTTKAQIENEPQRERIVNDSLFGEWIDAQKKIRVRITPVRDSIRIRIVEILDRSVIDAIVFFCGLDVSPRRSKWAHFDLVTNLRRHFNPNTYNFGDVHLPFAPHRTTASLVITEKSQVHLNFFRSEDERPEACTGSIIFYKDPNCRNARMLRRH